MRPLVLLLAAGLTGCATRALPAAFPAHAAASTAAQPAPEAKVTTALRGEPPLPGNDTSEWSGLEASEAASGSGAQGGEGQGHDHH
jgi:hypothetical protein